MKSKEQEISAKHIRRRVKKERQGREIQVHNEENDAEAKQMGIEKEGKKRVVGLHINCLEHKFFKPFPIVKLFCKQNSFSKIVNLRPRKV